MTRARLLPLALAVVAVATATLLGEGGGGEPAAADSPVAAGDLGSLVAQLSAGDSGAVVRRLERDAEARPRDAGALALLGIGYQQLFREQGDPSWLSRSGEALRRSVAAGGRTPLAVGALASLAVSQHRFRAAIPLAREALRADPESTSALAALADALAATGRYDEAHRAIDRLAALGPSVGAYARVAHARRALGRPAAALEAMELALEAGSGIPEQEAWAHVQHGGLLLARGRVAEAERSFRVARSLVPGYVQALAGLARVDAARGRYARAAERLQRVVARMPSPAYAIQLGDVLARDGRPAAAARAYELVDTIERLLAANGVRTELQTALFDLDHDRGVADALRRAREAHASAPSVEAADAVAWGLERSGRCLEARRWSRRTLRLGTEDGLFLFHRGMIERCLGSADAQSWFRRALAADPWFSLRWRPLAVRLAA